MNEKCPFIETHASWLQSRRVKRSVQIVEGQGSMIIFRLCTNQADTNGATLNIDDASVYDLDLTRTNSPG